MMYEITTLHKPRVNHLARLREEYGVAEFRFLPKRTYKATAEKINSDRSAISRIADEARILAIFPHIEKSKAVPLARIRTNRELKIFSQKYDVYKLQCREIYKLVKQWRIDIEKNPRLLLSDIEHDLIIGSTIGDANIRQRNKNCMFRVGHTVKQKKYIEWKQEVLKNFKTQGVQLRQRIINEHLINFYNFDINTHYIFNNYRKLFYDLEGVKRVTTEILDQINPRSLSIWLCDDGSYGRKQKYIVFCTNSYTLEEHRLMKKWFEEKFNLSPSIGFRDNKYYYLRFTKADTAKLVEIVRPFIIPSMKYKIGEQNE